MLNNKLKINRLGFTLVEILAALLLIGLVLPAEILLQQEWKNSNGAGRFEDEFETYQWTMYVSDWTMAGIKQVDLMVYWQQRNRQRNVTLSTLVYANEQ